jgi:hypothetical protein
MWLRSKAKPGTVANLPPVPVAKIFSAVFRSGASPIRFAVTCKAFYDCWQKYLFNLSGSRDGTYVLQWLKIHHPRTACNVLLQLGVNEPVEFIKRLALLADGEEQLCR